MTAAARTQDRITQPVDAHWPRANHPQTAHDATHEARTEPPLGRPAGRQSPRVRMFFTFSRARFARRRPHRCLRPAWPLRADALRAGGRGAAGTEHSPPRGRRQSITSASACRRPEPRRHAVSSQCLSAVAGNGGNPSGTASVPTTCPASSEGARNRGRHDRQTPVEPGSRTLCNTLRLPSGARGRGSNPAGRACENRPIAYAVMTPDREPRCRREPPQRRVVAVMHARPAGPTRQ